MENLVLFSSIKSEKVPPLVESKKHLASPFKFFPYLIHFIGQSKKSEVGESDFKIDGPLAHGSKVQAWKIESSLSRRKKCFFIK